MDSLPLTEYPDNLQSATITDVTYYAESLISYDVLLEIICGEKTDKQDYSYFLHICAVNIPSDRRFLRVTPEGGVDACGKVTDKNTLWEVDYWSDDVVQFKCNGYIIVMDENGNLAARIHQGTPDYHDDTTKFLLHFNAGYTEFSIESKANRGLFFQFNNNGQFVRPDFSSYNNNQPYHGQFFRPFAIQKITTV